MRVFGAVWCVLVLAGAARAAPVPPPPDDFSGSQYIDGTGCVFERQGEDWIARLDSTSQPICGFPPSMSSRRTDPDTPSVLTSDPEEPPAQGIEDMLVEQLASGLRQGEFTADPRPAEIRKDVPARDRPNALQVQLDKQVQNEAKLRAAMVAAGNTTSDLCAQLGYVPDDDPKPFLGGDVTQGLCPGMRAATPAERVLAGERLEATGTAVAVVPGSPAAQPGKAEAAKTAVARADPLAVKAPVAAAAGGTSKSVTTKQVEAAKPAATARADTAAKVAPASSSSVQARRVVKPGPATPPMIEMIPASARYVQVGAYTEDENAMIVIRRLSEMGYRTAQSFIRDDNRTFRLVMAGPFKDRQALVAALNQLRKQGYPQAVAR